MGLNQKLEALEAEQNEHTFLVAITVNDSSLPTREAAELALYEVLPKPGGPTFVGPTVTEWWIAEDDRRDRSDRDSAVFVPYGTQAGESFDRLPEAARATIRAALADAADLTFHADDAAECRDCVGLHDPDLLCEDHAADRAKAAAYRDLLDLIGA